VLDGFEVGRKEAEELNMAARVAAGWVTEEELEKARAQQAEAAAAAEAAKAAEAAQAQAASPAAAKL
jgi:N utilization substance protein A